MVRTRNKSDRLIDKAKDFGRIGLLMGGPSAEREVSLKSGAAVLEALTSIGCDVVAIDLKDDNKENIINQIKKYKIKIAFIALHGQFGEDGTLQKLLDENKIPYTGSGVEASALAMNKIASRRIFEDKKIPVPNYVIWDTAISGNFDLLSLNGLVYPLVVKPSNQGSSIGISMVEKKKNLTSALKIAHKFSSQIIIEEYVPGKEITVGILEDKPLPVLRIVPKNKFYDYGAKYELGTEYEVPAKISKEEFTLVQEKGLAAHQALGCRSFSRVDMILKDNSQVAVLEVNTIPGLTAASLLPKAAKAMGIDFPQLCLKLINSIF